MTPEDIEALLAAFREEGKELVARVDEELLKIEAAPGDGRQAASKAILRTLHTLKGTAGSVGLKATTTMSHAIEDVLKVYDMSTAGPGVFELLHRAADVLVLTLDDRRMPPAGREILPELQRLIGAVPATGVAGAAPPAVTAETTTTTRVPVALPDAGEDVRISFDRLADLMALSGELSLRLLGAAERGAEIRRTAAELTAIGAELAKTLGRDSPLARRLASVERSMLASLSRFEFAFIRDALLSDELHASVRILRLRSLSTVFRPLPRMARDLAGTLGKQVNVTVAGGTVEVEKSVLDVLRNVLVHLMRNAIDHGLEAPEERRTAGKAPAGKVHVSARVAGNYLLVEFTDDGRGVDGKKVKASALHKGLITQAEADAMLPEAAQELIFLAGFSTKDVATDISGRGVGLDAVRAEVERGRGSIRLSSTLGQGSTFIVQLPLLAHRSHVLLVRAGEESLALPSTAVWRVFSLGPNQAVDILGQPSVAIDGTTVPLVHLTPLVRGGERRSIEPPCSVVALLTQGRAIACAVDALVTDDEIVIRDVDPPITAPTLVSGVGVRSNGDVLCILNPLELMRLAGVRAPVEIAEAPVAPARARRILVVDDSFTVRMLEKSILEMAGYVVDVAEDGEEALAILERQDVDLVVSDINMPKKDGFELLSAVRGDPGLRNLPFILVSSRASAPDRKRGLELGAQAYVAKSEFNQEVLLDAVARFAG